MRSAIPLVTAGMRIGLLGGSFDPPHQGHMHITVQALRRCRLDRVWWLVSPGNPLKSEVPSAVELRVASAREQMRHPRTAVTDIELELGTRYTADTLRELLPRFPGVKFIWLMGADSLVELHHWRDWRWIMNNIAVAVLARRHETLRAAESVAANVYRRWRLPQDMAPLLASSKPPRWSIIKCATVDVSSTQLRAQPASGPLFGARLTESRVGTSQPRLLKSGAGISS